MAENKKVVTETTEKVMTKYDKKIQKRKEAEQKAKREKLKSHLTSAAIVIAVIAFIAYFPIKNGIATNSTYMQVGEAKITELEFDYYYNLSVNNFLSQNDYLLAYMGLDTSKDFADQEYNEYLTWDDYFQQITVENIKYVKSLVQEGKAAGFTYDTTADVEEHNRIVEESAAQEGVTVKDYVKATMGEYATLKNMKDIIAETYYAAAYYDKVYADINITEEAIKEYYESNKKDYDSVDFKVITVNADVPEGETTTDEEGNTTTAEPAEEEVALAMNKAKVDADKKVAVIDSEGTLNENKQFANISIYYSNWLFDEERVAGDVSVFENNNEHCYYVVQFVDRYLADTKAVNVRAIATTTDKGALIVDEWKNTGANEEAFLALVEKYSEDTYTNTTGGLYENLPATGLSDELSVWLLDETRKEGDVEAISSSSGYFYVLYYLGQGEVEWKASIDSLLSGKDMEAYMDKIMGALEVVDTKGKLTYEEAIEAEKAAAAASSEVSTEVSTEKAE